MNFCKFVAFSFLLRTQMVHLKVSFIIYSALSMPSFAVHFVRTFEKLAKTFQFLKTMCDSRKYPYPSHGWLLRLDPPHPLGISVPEGSCITPHPPDSRSYLKLFLIYAVACDACKIIQTFTNIKTVVIVQKIDLIQKYYVNIPNFQIKTFCWSFFIT